MNKKGLATIAAAAMLAIPLSMNIANAETAQAQNKQAVVLDTTPTGSVQRVDAARDCNPSVVSADIICKITGGDSNTKFPSAPISNFGF